MSESVFLKFYALIGGFYDNLRKIVIKEEDFEGL